MQIGAVGVGGTMMALVLAGTALADAPATRGETVLIDDATIFDATGREPFRGDVLIRNGRIVQVGANVRAPRGARVIDAQGRALLPGFIDVHTHWGPAGNPGALPAIATAYVRAGVTTVNDFHQQPEAFAPRRAWLASIAAPHVRFVARMSTPGGHGTDWADTNTTRWVATPESARLAVRALQPYRPDAIKAFADGWRYGASPDNTSMNVETLTALTDEAHRQGQRVLTHTVTVARGAEAGRAKVDVIAHSIQDRRIDAATIAQIRAGGTFYAPTLAIYEPVKPGERAPDMTTPAQQRRLQKYADAQYNVKALHDAGVPVALGTDAGIGGTKHGFSTLREMELLVEAGLSPRAALLAGTANSARALGIADDRGTIEAGKRADLILIDGTPWARIADVHKVDRVFIDGRLVHGPGIALPAGNSATALPPALAPALIDDFERTDGRSSLDTLRLDLMDYGTERSLVVANRIPRGSNGHALMLAARMAAKEAPFAGVLVPLRRGSVQPVDARAFTGIELDLRGSGEHRVVVNTLAGSWEAQVAATADWTRVRVPFATLRPAGRDKPTTWRGDDLLQVGIELHKPAGESVWSTIDNLRFYSESD